MKKNLKALLADKLKPQELELISKSYDIIGDIAVIRITESLKKHNRIIARAIMQTHKQVKTVCRQITPVSGDFRLRNLEFVLGERKTETLHREYGCIFKVDLGKCYFSPRLSYERMRIAQHIQQGETILNMFSGVGSYSIIIAKHSKPKKIFSIDINPTAIQYMRENIKLNKIEERVIPIQEDSRKAIEERFPKVADRVLMPLPERAHEYLGSALLALNPNGGWIHYYAFEHAKRMEDPIEKTRTKVSEKLHTLDADFEVTFGRVVRTTGPNWYQVVLDIRLKN
ncbi:MAG: class I SAM-dependent methyltransferase family protein [Candidatus Bathyarchaeota archaeon]|nr:MAG: class I SAM-dependent methyltransferase family protein [Candidatus Bathyarchaeota archaeon]